MHSCPWILWSCRKSNGLDFPNLLGPSWISWSCFARPFETRKRNHHGCFGSSQGFWRYIIRIFWSNQAEQHKISSTISTVTEQAVQQAQSKFEELDKEYDLRNKATKLGKDVEESFANVFMTSVCSNFKDWSTIPYQRKHRGCRWGYQCCSCWAFH